MEINTAKDRHTAFVRELSIFEDSPTGANEKNDKLDQDDDSIRQLEQKFWEFLGLDDEESSG